MTQKTQSLQSGLQMNEAQLMTFMREVFHQVADDFKVDHVAENEITMRLLVAIFYKLVLVWAPIWPISAA